MPSADVAAKVHEVQPGIFQLHLPLPVRPSIVNVYLIRGDGEWALVDTGVNTPESIAFFQCALEVVGCAPERIGKIICTHHHPDHFGASKTLRELTGAKLYFPRPEYESACRFASGISEDLVREFFRFAGLPTRQWGGRIPSPREMWARMYLPAEPDVFVEDGSSIRVGDVEWRAVFTPGHTRAHCVLYQPERRTLVAGDHLLPKITPHVGYYPGGPPNPLSDFLESQRLVQGMDIDFVLPAHGGVFTEHRHRAGQIIHHHELRLQEILDLLRGRAWTAYDLARQVWAFDVDSSLAVQFPATFESLAHLEYLRHDGRAMRDEVDGQVLYAAAPCR